MQNAVIYARYSSHGQNEQSIEGQLKDCYEYAKSLNLNVIGEYIDRAISGRYDNRAEFLRMIEDSQAKAFQYIIVWKLDRFARNRYDSAVYKHKLKKNGVRVVSAKQQISDNPESIFVEAMLEANDEYYSANLSQNVKRGQKITVAKGNFIGGHCLYGYKVVANKISDNHIEKKVVVHEQNAAAVRLMFTEYAKGKSKLEIIKLLNEKSYKNASGKPFTINSFQNTLRNEKYTGTFTYGGDIVCDNMYPPIIEKALFDKVQIMLERKKHRPAERKAKVTYLLSGKAWCGHCGSPIVGVSATSKTKDRHHYYACSVRWRKKECNKKHEKKDFLEWYVCEQTIAYILQPQIIDYIADKIILMYEKDINETKIKSLEARITAIDLEMKKTVDSFIEANSSVRIVLNDKMTDLEAQKNDLRLEAEQLRLLIRVKHTKADIESWLKQFCNGDLFDYNFRRRIIDILINSVYIYDKLITIYYNIGSEQACIIEEADNDDIIENLGDVELTLDSGKSVLISNALPRQSTLNTNPSNNVYYVFVNGLFGIVILR